MAHRPELTLFVDPDAPLTLQHQLRRKLVDAIERGVLPPGSRVPSSRSLAEQARVSRNTVTLACDALVAEGYLVSRPRSGLYVGLASAERVAGTHPRRRREPAVGQSAVLSDWRASPAESEEFRRPPNWHHYPYPFIDGCIDPALVPHDEWREALRVAFGRREIARWGQAGAEHDDPMLIEELRMKALGAWDIEATADQLLATASVRQSLWLALETLAARATAVWHEPDLDADLRRRLGQRHSIAGLIDRDDEGPVAPDALPARSLVILGSRRVRVGHMLDAARARDWLKLARESRSILVECTPPHELREPTRGLPSLRSLDTEGIVVFVSGLAGSAAVGAAPGFVCAEPRVIDWLRQARRLQGGEFSPGLQRTWAHYLALGHYGAVLARTGAELKARRMALRDALNHYLHKFVEIGQYARSSAYWVRGAAGLDSGLFAASAASVGVLVEPSDEPGARNEFVMGVTGLPRSRIRAGVEQLARLIRRDPALGSHNLRDEVLKPLRARALHRAIAGKTLLYNTAYGEPCTIEVRRDGSLAGTAGYAGEDCDTGRWWVEGDLWVRQWRSWAYGESLALHTIVEGDQVRWYRPEGILVDTALIVR